MDRSLMNKVTSGSVDTVDGYDLCRISDMSHTSMLMCIELEEYLIGRLMSDSVHTKLKTLRIIRHLAEKGNPIFKKNIKQKSHTISMLEAFNGPVDTLHGDTINKNIRQEAKKCLQTLFNDNLNQNLNNTDFKHRIQGIASSEGWRERHIGDLKGQNSGDKSRYIGFGNTLGNAYNNNNNNNNNYNNVANSAWKLINEVADKYIPNVKAQIVKNAPFIHTHQNYTQNSHHLYPSTLPSIEGGYTHKKMLQHPQKSFNHNPNISSHANEYETKLIENLLSPGGVVSSIPSTMLTNFVMKCRSLDIEIIGDLLCENYIKTTDEMIKSRNLSIFIALLTSNDVSIQKQQPSLHNIIHQKLVYSLNHTLKNTQHKHLYNQTLQILTIIGLHTPETNKQEENLFDFVSPNIEDTEEYSNSLNDFFVTKSSDNDKLDKNSKEIKSLFESPSSPLNDTSSVVAELDIFGNYVTGETSSNNNKNIINNKNILNDKNNNVDSIFNDNLSFLSSSSSTSNFNMFQETGKISPLINNSLFDNFDNNNNNNNSILNEFQHVHTHNSSLPNTNLEQNNFLPFQKSQINNLETPKSSSVYTQRNGHMLNSTNNNTTSEILFGAFETATNAYFPKADSRKTGVHTPVSNILDNLNVKNNNFLSSDISKNMHNNLNLYNKNIDNNNLNKLSNNNLSNQLNYSLNNDFNNNLNYNSTNKTNKQEINQSLEFNFLSASLSNSNAQSINNIYTSTTYNNNNINNNNLFETTNYPIKSNNQNNEKRNEEDLQNIFIADSFSQLPKAQQTQKQLPIDPFSDLF